VIYSVWLKRATPQNIVIGGAAGRLPPDDRLGGGDRRRRGRERADVRADLPVDPAAFLGARALPQRGLRPRRRADAAGDARPARHPQPDPRLRAAARAGRGLPAFTSVGGPGLSRRRARAERALPARRLAGLAARRDGRPPPTGFRAEKRFFGFSILYLFLGFGLFLLEAGLRAAGLVPAGWPVLV
jgi:heme o synthase